jgi:hypothetical protein
MTTADGTGIPLDAGEAEFARAMAAPEPGTRPDYPPPPKRDPGAPHGRGKDGEPLAPFGTKPDGTPRMNRPGPGRGHTGRNEQARVQKPPPGKAAATGKPAPESDAEIKVRRAADAQTTLELMSAGGSLLSMVMSARAQARGTAAQRAGNQKALQAATQAHERATVLQLDSAACALHAETVGPSLAELSAQNQWAAAIVDRLAIINGVASVGMAVLPLVYQITANHAPAEARDNLPPELMTLGVLPPALLMEKLAAQNAVKMARMQSAILAERNEAEAELARLQQQAAA